MDLFSLIAKIGLDSKEYENGVKQADLEGKKFKGGIELLGSTISGMSSKLKLASNSHKELKAELADSKREVSDLTGKFNEAVSKYGAGSEQAKKYKTELDKAVQSQKQIKDELAASQSPAQKFGDALKNAGSTAVSVSSKALGSIIKFGAASVTAAAGAVAGLAKIGFDYNTEMETYKTNFKVMLGSEQDAVAKVDELKKFAAKTPLSMADLAQGTKTLLAFGVANEDSTTRLRQLGDIALGNSDKMQSLANAFGKATAQGKLSGEVVQSMVDAGWNPLLTISQKTGESMEQVQKRMANGAISVDELTAAMETATSEGGQFYNGMEEASKTTAGLMSTLKDNFSSLVGEVFQPMSDSILQNLLPTAIGYIDQLSTTFREEGVSGLVSAVGDIVADMLLKLAESLPSFLTTAVGIVISLVDGLTGNMDRIIDSIIKITIAMLNGLMTLLPKLAEFAVTFALKLGAALLSNLPIIVDKVLQIGTNIVEGIRQGIANAWGDLVSWFSGLFGDLVGIAKRILGIHSPSKVFSEIGKFTAEGFGLGWEKEFDGVKKQIGDDLDFESNIDYSPDDPNPSSGGFGTHVVQNIYSKAQTAADLMQEALYEQEKAVLLGV